MSIQTLKDRLPDYAKDLKLNLGSLAAETVLNDTLKAGTFVAAAFASRNPEVIAAVNAEFGAKLAPADFTAAKAAAAIMGMNNVYYRFLHLAENDGVRAPARQAAHERDRGAGHRQGKLRVVVAGGIGNQRLRHVHQLARQSGARRGHRPRNRCRLRCALPPWYMPWP